ncbi:hypothetical protein PUMCH_003904 [Australozyma saopauloensis]|uniref:Uncharacterized protein n=1 Tax=Australozyma saopauloensis TaxID=291208 RepID=A0AAX4HDK8_9ASCO|nr:hypothetical protein PUMCH_003904 [[Candida] saopauloensis]
MLNPSTPRLSRRQGPSTPPTSTKKPGLQKLPVFRLPKDETHKQLETPALHGLRRVVDLAPPTQDAFPLLPQFTPHKSPHHRRRRVFPGELFNTDAVSVLLPNHAVSGSGRKTFGGGRLLKAPFQLACDELALLNENLAFEEDDDESNVDTGSDTEFCMDSFYGDSLMASPSRKPRAARRAVVLEPSPEVYPSTPQKQMITEEKAREWHLPEKKNDFLTEEDWAGPKNTLRNPFLSSSSSSSPSRKTRGQNMDLVNFDTHIELINHRTGERHVEELSPEQKQLRPRKIDFSAI